MPQLFEIPHQYLWWPLYSTSFENSCLTLFGQRRIKKVYNLKVSLYDINLGYVCGFPIKNHCKCIVCRSLDNSIAIFNDYLRLAFIILCIEFWFLYLGVFCGLEIREAVLTNNSIWVQLIGGTCFRNVWFYHNARCWRQNISNSY